MMIQLQNFSLTSTYSDALHKRFITLLTLQPVIGHDLPKLQ